MIAIIAVAAVTLGAVGLGGWGIRFRTTSDLFVASRAISPWWNSAAVCGEYLSAASFLGIAGLAMKLGIPALWQGVGFTAGYVALLLFVAAPLRRFGSYTIPDFAEGRFSGTQIRTTAVVVVLVIATFYVVPQLKAAGLALGELTGSAYWVGIALVSAVVSLNVALGGMRGITYVQAYQFWIKVVAISVPAVMLLIHFGGLPDRAVLAGGAFPHAPSRGLAITLRSSERVTFPAASAFVQHGVVHVVRAGQQLRLGAGKIFLESGSAVPVPSGTEAKRGEDWVRPIAPGGSTSPLFIYSLLVATFLGTMGLPHILTRFYTNPDGRAARRTTVRVIGLLSVFYLFPGIYGALGRALAPGLYVTGQTDSVVLRLPMLAWPGTVGKTLGALTAAGAFAAFMSTSSGLLVSIAGTISHDIWQRGHSDARSRRRRFRIAALGGLVIPALIALAAQTVDISVLVGWAFALAASTFCPMFVLGIWWPRLTPRAATRGMVAGGTAATLAIVTGLLLGVQNLQTAIGALLTQPAIISVPISFLTMAVVSLRDPTPQDVTTQMLSLHAPEGLGLEPLKRA